MLSEIIAKFHRLPSKIKTDVQLVRPPYVDRHKGKDFLVLGSGPSLKEYQEQVQEFIDQHQPIVMGCNFLNGMFIPDYHGFVNRQMFSSYAETIHSDSKILLSPYFPDHMIKKKIKKGYEIIPFTNIYPSEKGSVCIQDGIILAQGATVGTILTSTAIVMGAQNIFVAGVDGYLKNKETHFYQESFDKTYEELVTLDKAAIGLLECCQNRLKEYHRGDLIIITPTAHEPFYQSIEKYLN